MNLPKTIQEFDKDDNEIITKICSALGRSVDRYNPVSFTDKEILSNFWTFMKDSMKDHFITGTTVDMESFATLPSDVGDDILNIDKEGKELGGTYQYPCNPPSSLGQSPCASQK